MTDDISVNVEGLEELEKTLLELGAEVGSKALRGALMDAAKPTMDTAKALAPVADEPHTGYKGKIWQPGELRDAIKRKSKVDHFGHAAEVEVGAIGNVAGWYAKFVEFGTAPHYLNRGAKRGTSRELSGNKYRRSASVRRMHPGAKPQPFLRPAWNQTRDGTISRFQERLRKRIENARKKAERRTARVGK